MPIVLLVIPSIFIGLFLLEPLIKQQFFYSSLIDTTQTKLFYDSMVVNPMIFTIHSLTSTSFYILVSGIIFSYFLYFKNSKILNIVVKKLSFTNNLLLSEYGFNNLSNNIIPNYFNKLGTFMWNKADKLLIDHTLVNGIARIVKNFSLKIRFLQTGYLYHYAFTMIVSLVIFLLIFYNY